MLNNKLIKINFTDFWSDFAPDNNYFYNILSKHFNIQLSSKPDFLIYSNFGNHHQGFNCTKIYFTGENIRPNFWETDFSISFDYPHHNHKNIRFPLYNLYGDLGKLLASKNATSIFNEKKYFCNMLVSNPNGKERIEFFHLLNQYKKVDSGGKYLNNIGGPVPNKRSFIRNYKFTMAFENSSYPGYTTEKIVEPMWENSIPIYWGNKKINTDFNTKSFVNVHDFGSLKEAAEYVAYLDQTDDKYLNMIKEPWLQNNQLNEYMDEKQLIRFFEHVFTCNHNKTMGSIKNKIAQFNFMKHKIVYRLSKKGK